MPRRSYWPTAVPTGCLGERSAWTTRSAVRGRPSKLTAPYSPMQPSFKKSGAAGTTLLELVVVVAIVGVLLAISAPSFQTSLKSAHLSAATSSVTAAIQSTRFNAIVSGCMYSIAFSQSTTTYQIGKQPLTGNPPACGTLGNSGSPISWSGSGDISLTPSITLQFCPNGTVGLYSAGTNTCTVAIPTFTLSNGTVATNTIIVSGAGNVKVTSP